MTDQGCGCGEPTEFQANTRLALERDDATQLLHILRVTPAKDQESYMLVQIFRKAANDGRVNCLKAMIRNGNVMHAVNTFGKGGYYESSEAYYAAYGAAQSGQVECVAMIWGDTIMRADIQRMVNAETKYGADNAAKRIQRGFDMYSAGKEFAPDRAIVPQDAAYQQAGYLIASGKLNREPTFLSRTTHGRRTPLTIAREY